MYTMHTGSNRHRFGYRAAAVSPEGNWYGKVRLGPVKTGPTFIAAGTLPAEQLVQICTSSLVGARTTTSSINQQIWNTHASCTAVVYN